MDEDGNLVDLDGFPDSIRFLVEYIQKNGPFDGVLGFSQGAGLAVLLLLILSQDDWRGRFNIPSHVPQFRLAIILSGFRFQTPNFADYYTRGMLDIPTMHVYSDQDTIISVDRSLDLINNTFTDAVQCKHDLG
jgi:predicted esterase